MCILVLSQSLLPRKNRVFLREQRCLMSQTYGLSINIDCYVNVYVIYFVFHYIRVLDNQKIFKVLSAGRPLLV